MIATVALLGQVPSAADADNAANAALAAAVADGSIGAGALKTVRVRATQINLPNATNDAATVNCAADERAIGGGARFVQFNPTATTPDLTIVSSRPVSDGGDPQVPTGQTLTGWRGAAANGTAGTLASSFVVYALCLGA